MTGPEALRSIEEALRDIRREEDEAIKRLARSVELTSKLREQEAELLYGLSAHGAAPEARVALAEAGARAEMALAGHEAGLAGIEARLASLDEAIAAAVTARAQLQTEIGKREGELRRLADRVRPSLSIDAAYTGAIARARSAAAMAEESLKKTAQAEADREHNGRSYRDDPLFMYLWEKGYGTGTYRANVLIGWLDSKVAAVADYASARANFSALNDIPLRLREHAERRQEIARAAAREVAAFESKALDAAGGRSTRETMEATLNQMHGVDAEIVALQDQRDEAIRAGRELAQGNEANFAAASAALVSAIGRPELATLLAEARGNPVSETVVQQIDDIRQRAGEQELEASEEKAQLKTLAARRRELEDIQYEMKAQGLDSPRSRFAREDLVGDVLNDFLRGGMTAAQYWQLWRESQSWDAGDWTARASSGTTFSRPRGRKAA